MGKAIRKREKVVMMELKNESKLTDAELEQVVGKHLKHADWDW